MHLYFFVEEASAEAALIELVPKILEHYEFEFDIVVFQGKTDMLNKLPHRLKAYRNMTGEDWRIVILVDRDSDDCLVLKRRLEKFAQDAGLITRTTGKNFSVINRVVIEELEAWFFGDVKAIAKAYSGIDENIEKQAAFRDPDAIRGGTWEALERILHKHHPGGLEKIRAAQEIAQHMTPSYNRSKSFQVFRDALLDLFK